MQITKSPNLNSSAFSESTAIFKVTATPTEIINVDIYDHAGTTIIGCKKYTGTTIYDVNVGNYAKQQIEVLPIRTAKVSLEYPPKRSIKVKIKIGVLTGNATLSASIEQLPLIHKLSKSPSMLNITPTQQDEISVLVDYEVTTATITMIGNRQTDSFIAGQTNGQSILSTLCINMKDVQTRLTAIGVADISQYHTMVVDFADPYESIATQKYRIVEDEIDDLRLCWWNHYGQIDYYTMKKTTLDQFSVDKNRIYTATGYKTISSKAQTITQLVSRYEDIATMKWLSEIVASPKVWMEKGAKISPIEILSNRITTSYDNLSRLEINITDPTKTTFQTT